MRTLIQPIAHWLTQGQSPRTFVRVTDSTGAEILFSGTQELTAITSVQGTAIDDIENFGNISKSIKPEGGASEVSTASVKNIILSNRLPLCTEVSLQPKVEGITLAAGRMISESAPYGSYASARNSSSGVFSSVGLVIGRQYQLSPLPIHRVWRSPIEFTVPADLTTCEDAYFDFTGQGDSSDIDFNIKIIAGNWPPGAEKLLDGTAFIDFDFWASSGDYTGIVPFNETLNTAQYQVGHNYIRGNAVFRAFIVANAGLTIKLMILSENDSTWTGHTTGAAGNEFVQFESVSARLKLRYNSLNLENQNIATYYGVAPLPAAYTGMDLMYTGVVDKYEISDRNFSGEFRQNNFKKNKMIPGSLILTSDYSLAHESIIGQAIPVVYGDFLTTRLHQRGIPNSINQNTAVEYGIQDMVKAYIYEKYTSGVMKVMITNHAIKTLGNAVTIYESGIKEFTQVTGDVAVIEGTNNAKITVQGNLEGAAQFPYKLTGNSIQPIAGYVPLDAQEFMAEPNTSLNCINMNISDFTSFLPGDSCVYHLNMTFPRETYGLSELNGNRYLVFKTSAATGYDTGFKIYGYFYQWDNTPVYAIWPAQVISADGWHYVEIVYPALPDQDILSYIFTFDNIAGGKTVKLYNVGFYVGYKKDIQGEIFISCQGMPDDGSGTVTGTASLLIENPSHVIESIARGGIGIDGKEWGLGLTTAEIDTTAFDTAATAISGMKFAFQLLEQKDSDEILGDLAYQAGMHKFYNSLNQLKILKFNAANPFPNSLTDIPQLTFITGKNSDVFTDTGLPVTGSFTTHQLISGLNLSKMKISDVKNDFILNYCYNYGSKQYAKTLRVSKDENNLDNTICISLGTTKIALSTLCADSYTVIKTVNTFTYDCWAIRDETTATALMKHLIERLSVMRWIIDFEAGDSAVLFEEGDFVNIRNDRLENRFGMAVMNIKKWMVINIDSNPKNHNVNLRVIEV